jgi:outer membrane receptor protein involved in Fe transport
MGVCIKKGGVAAVAAGVFLAAGTVGAEEDLPVFELPPLVVTASRVPQTAEEVPVNLTVLDGAAIDASPALVMDDLLRQVPGFSLFRRSSSLVAHPTTQGVSLRGVGPTGASRSLVLLDGIPINDPFGGWVHWSRVPMLAVDRVEVVRGGGSTVWGNSAMGGVINILSHPYSEPAFRVEGLAGNRGTERVGLYFSEEAGPVGWGVSAQHFATDGYRTVREDQRGPIDIPAYSRHLTLGGGVVVSLGPEAELGLNLTSFAERRGNGTPYTGNETDSIRFSSSLAWTAGESVWELLFFGDRTDFSSRFSAVAPGRAAETPALDQFDVPGTAAGAGVVWSRQFDRHRLTSGLDGRWIDGATHEDFFFSEGRFNNRRRAGGRQVLTGVFVEDLFEPSPDWQLSLGGRLDYWRSFSGELRQWRIETGDELAREQFSDRDVLVFNPRAGLVRHVNPNVSLRGAAYQGFRVPTINELYRPFRVGQDTTLANAALDPERLTGAEAGLDYEITRRWSGKVTGFWNLLEDPIANVTLGPAAGGGIERQRQNLGRATIRGVEVESGFQLNRHWRLFGSYLFSDTEVDKARQQPDLEGKRLAQVPQHQAVLGSGWNWESYRVNLQSRYIGAQFEDDLNTRRLGDFWLFDLQVAREFAPGSAIFAGVENLFDRTYEVGITGDGLVTIGGPRMVHGGVRWMY